MGFELGEALHKAGIIPDFTRDAIIEIPVHGPVVIHMSKFGEKNLLEVLPAKAIGATVVDHAKGEEKHADVSA